MWSLPEADTFLIKIIIIIIIIVLYCCINCFVNVYLYATIINVVMFLSQSVEVVRACVHGTY